MAEKNQNSKVEVVFVDGCLNSMTEAQFVKRYGREQNLKIVCFLLTLDYYVVSIFPDFGKSIETGVIDAGKSKFGNYLMVTSGLLSIIYSRNDLKVKFKFGRLDSEGIVLAKIKQFCRSIVEKV